jgi:type IV secretory pathway VirB10-like protein
MNKWFLHHLTAVTLVHVALILTLVMWSVISGCFRKKPETVLPVEFVVDVTPPGPDKESKNEPPAPKSKDDIPEPKPKKADKKPPEKPKKEPEPKPAKEPIKISDRKVVRDSSPPKRGQNRLSEEEIRRLLALGAKPSDHTVIPGLLDMSKLMVKNALFDRWDPPSREASGNAVTVVRVWFREGGWIDRWKIESPSGIQAFDESVSQVFGIVKQIPNLAGDFISEYRFRGFTIDFRLEE